MADGRGGQVAGLGVRRYRKFDQECGNFLKGLHGDVDKAVLGVVPKRGQ